MKKKLFCLFLALSFGVGAQNLIRDPEVDNENLLPEFRISEGAGLGTLTRHVEEATWNRCLKLELKQYRIDKDGLKNVSFGVMFGGDRDGEGFPCKPDTAYRFSVEVKGQAKRAMFNFYEWDGLPASWKNRRKMRASIHLIHPQKEWTVYRGVFKTGATAGRAALMLQFWGEEKSNQLEEKIGDYLLIDKIVIEEDSEPVIAAGKTAGVRVMPAGVYLAPEKQDWTGIQPAGDFKVLRTGQAAAVQTDFQVRTDAEAIYLRIKCRDPEPGKVKAAYRDTGGLEIWNDDAVEIFFDAVKPDRRLSQFVVSAAGGRWMGYGSPAKVDSYREWNAVSRITGEGWECEVTIPFKTLGYPAAPRHGDMIRFNICRQRSASAEYSSFSFQPVDFHDPERFGTLFFGSMKPYADKIIAAAAEFESEKSVAGIITGIDLDNPSLAMGGLLALEKQIRLLKLGREKFILAAIPPTVDPAVPFLPRELNNESTGIRVRAAVNEQAPLVLALGNMTELPEEYRITVTAGWRRLQPQDERMTDEPGLRSASDDLFPGNKIMIRRGVAYKDSDAPNHGRRYDILAALNEASTVPVPPREGGLIWINFDCRGIKPGIYRGAITVIPFNQANTLVKHAAQNGYILEGGHKRYELELEVLPIILPVKSSMPFNAYRTALRDDIFEFMNEYDCFMYMVTPWFFTFKFNQDGSVRELLTREFLDPWLALLARNLRKSGMTANPRIMIGYSAYDTFRKVIVPENIAYDSEAYWNAWRNWCQGVDTVLKKHGISNDEYTVEVFDEPQVSKNSYREIVKAHTEAKRAVPEMQLLQTSGLPPGEFKEPYFEEYFTHMSRLLDQWIFASYRMGTELYRKYMKQYREIPGKMSGVYACGTNMRQDLYRYYRMLPWHALDADCDFVSLYQMYEQTIAADFYKSPEGGVTYISQNGIIPSVRLEAFRVGQTDIKYMKLLESLARGDSGTAKEARAFLKDAAWKVVTAYAHDRGKADEIRNRAIEYILLLQDGK